MFRSALLKLTAAYLAIVMTISLVFSAVLYRLATHELGAGLHNQYLRWETQYQPFGLRLPGSPSSEIEARSHHILVQLIYFNISILIVSGLVSYLLARRTLRPIEAAHEHQKRFTADVSHELRTPLTAIKMETEVALLDKKASVSELRKTLESNLEEVHRLEGLINNLLQISSSEESSLRAEFEELDLAEVVGNATRTVQKHANAKHIQLETNVTSVSIVGDRSSLSQLFVILLDNAVKYSPEKSTVTIKVSQHEDAATVTVRDTGIGISPDAVPHIFDRFYRANKARDKQGAQGFGLGLSLAKLIADLHHGEIIVSSHAGKGTTVVVNLPSLNGNQPLA